MYNEEECIRLCKAGKTDAFEGIVQAYEKKIYNLAFRMTGNHEDANDLAQEAFVKVYHSIGTFRGDAKFSTWLYRIATNVCLDELRRKGRRKVEHLDEPVFTEDGALEREIPDWSANPEEAFETREIQNLVQNGMKQLPDEQRIVLVLRDIQGYSYEEIAEMLNLSLGTIKSRINRGRLALKELLSQDRELFFLSPRQNERRG